MANGEKLDFVALKDHIPAIATLGAVVAITFNLGSFAAIGLGQYSFFSLPEHLGFALEAAPQALSFALAMVIGALLLNARKLTASVEEGVFWTCIIVQTVVTLSELFEKRYAVVSISGPTVVFLLWLKFIIQEAQFRGRIRFGALAGILATTFLIGYRIEKQILSDQHPKYSIKLTAGSDFAGQLIESGDRGVLFYVSTSKEQFFRWNHIERIRREASDMLQSP